MKKLSSKKIATLFLFLILFGAFFVRFYDISSAPSGIYPDEAQNGVDAQYANSTGQYKWFYETNNGREALFINIQAMSIKYIGNTVLGLKLPSIIFGTLTALGVFLLCFEMFKSYAVGLMGAYMIAFSYWAINFSRIGFRAIMVPLILVFTFYFIFRGIRTKKFIDFAIGGFIYGLGLHTYIAFRVSPLVLIILFISLALIKKHFIKEYWKQTLIFSLFMFISSSPMLLDFFYFNPAHYESRTSAISVFNPATNQGSFSSTLAKTFFLSLAKYNFWGDQNFRHNYPPYPLLNPITGISFLIGLIYIIIQFFRLGIKRFKNKVRDTRFAFYSFLLAWFFVLLIPEFLAAEGNPHSLRAIGTLPVVIIISAIPFIWVFDKYKSFGYSFKIFSICVLTSIFLFIGLFDTIKYFVFFKNNPKQHQAFEANLIEVSNYINSFNSETKKYIVTGSMQRLPIQYLNEKKPNIIYLYPGQANDINPEDKNFVIVFTEPVWQTINSTRDKFRDITFQQHTNKFGDTFYTLKY